MVINFNVKEMVIWSVVILFIIYSYIEGDVDGDYWEMLKGRLSQTQSVGLMDDHVMLFARRVIVGLALSISLFDFTANAILFLICLGLIFSLCHNGAYYLRRNELNPNVYKNGFFAYSLTSKARMEFTFVQRLVLFIIGIVGIVLIQVYGR